MTDEVMRMGAKRYRISLWHDGRPGHAFETVARAASPIAAARKALREWGRKGFVFADACAAGGVQFLWEAEGASGYGDLAPHEAFEESAEFVVRIRATPQEVAAWRRLARADGKHWLRWHLDEIAGIPTTSGLG